MVVRGRLAIYKLVAHSVKIRFKGSRIVAEAEVYHRSARVGVVITASCELSELSAVLVFEIHQLRVDSVIGLEVEISRNHKLKSVGEVLDVLIKEVYLLRSYVRVGMIKVCIRVYEYLSVAYMLENCHGNDTVAVRASDL